MSPETTVSVVIPAFKAADTLPAALASAWAQRVPGVEVIVVDDASPDATADVAESLCAGRPDSRVIRLGRNQGPAAARNAGVAAARGEWIAFLDGDDEWLPWRLALQLESAALRPEVALWCGRPAPFRPGEPGPDVPEPVRPLALRALSLEELAVHNPVATSTVLVRREAVLAAGGFDPQFRGPEDYDLWLRVAARHAVVFLDAPLARYRLMTGSLSLDDRRFLPEILRVLDKAYGPGGVLHGRPGAGRARGYHTLACSWMAAERGDVGRALRIFARSLAYWPWPYAGRYNPLPWARLKLLKYFARRAAAGIGRKRPSYM